MWELWTRSVPWEEVKAEGIAFVDELTALVTSGARPALPDGTGAAPRGYRTLMEACWATDPTDRPPFSPTIVGRLDGLDADAAGPSVSAL